MESHEGCLAECQVECQVVVWDGQEQLLWRTDDTTALAALASLVARPESAEELLAAMRRYLPVRQLPLPCSTDPPDGSHLLPKLNSAQPWCLIDLQGQTIVGGNGFEQPESGAAYRWTSPPSDDDHRQTRSGGRSAGPAASVERTCALRFELPQHWEMIDDVMDWQQRVVERRQAMAHRMRFDPREVLYGLPLLEHLAQGLLNAYQAAPRASRRPCNSAAEEIEFPTDTMRAIHADWLLQPRDDLAGRSPRDGLLEFHDEIGEDIWFRSEQWSRQGYPPPPLPRESAAYRFGGFGLGEIVSYFEVIRELLEQGWVWLLDQAGDPAAATLEGDSERQAARPDRATLPTIDELVTFLKAGLAASWQKPDDSLPLTRGEIVDLERQRIPLVASDPPDDCDCPICAAERDHGHGIAFSFYDSCVLEMEGDFAFSLIKSREEWELTRAELFGLEELEEEPANSSS